MNLHGRVAVCGAISQYNNTGRRPAPRNLPQMISKRLTIQGLLVLDHSDRREEFVGEIGGWLAGRGDQVPRDGRRRAGERPVGAARPAGENIGKMLVTV